MSLGFLAVSAAHCRHNVSPRTLSGSEYMRRLTTGREQSCGRTGRRARFAGGRIRPEALGESLSSPASRACAPQGPFLLAPCYSHALFSYLLLPISWRLHQANRTHRYNLSVTTSFTHPRPQARVATANGIRVGSMTLGCGRLYGATFYRPRWPCRMCYTKKGTAQTQLC